MPKPRPSRKPAGRLDLRATVRVLKAAAGEQRRFELIAYTGEAMSLDGFDLPVVVDCAGLDVSAQLYPALFDHELFPGAVVGQIDSVTVAGGLPPVVAGGYFTPTDDPLDITNVVLGKADAGYVWQASVRGPPGRMERVEAGQTGEANGRTYPGPCLISRSMVLREISFTVLGGDRHTQALLARHRRSIKGAQAMNPTYEEWLASLGFADPAALDATQDANMRLLYAEAYPEADAETPADAAADPAADPEGLGDQVTAADANGDGVEDEEPVVTARGKKPVKANAARRDPVADINRQVAANEVRISRIRDIAAQYGNPTVKVGARQVPLVAHAIAARWSPDRAENYAIKASRPSGPHLHMPNRDNRAAPTGQVIEAAICAHLKQPDLDKRFKPQILDEAHSQFKGRIGLQQVVMIAAAAGGYRPAPGERLHNGNLKSVLKAASAEPEIRAASGASTVSLPGIFSNVANKELLLGYMEEDQSWREVSASKPVPDFKSITSYRLLDDMAYEEVGANGEIKHGKVSEESYSRQAKTYAKMFTLTRRDMINDDLGAFSDLRNRLGRGAAQKFNDVFWTEFMSDASTFWTTARTNYITGSTTNLGADGVGLGLGVKAFRLMTSPTADGTKRIGGQPEILLVPPELEQIAEGLYVNQNLGAVKNSDANIYAGKYRVVVCPWLSDSAFTGYSTTAWYLLRNPGMMPAVVASFLNGNEAPTVEDSEADFDTLGWQFRGYHDFGVDQAEYLCGIKSKGAA